MNKTPLKSLPGEVWKSVMGYEDLYWVSSKGRMKSSYYLWKEIVAEKPNKYKVVILVKDGTKKASTIHRMVALHFKKNPKSKPCVNHRNGLKHDNRASNIEWATHKENSEHSFRTGLSIIPSGRDNPMFGRTGFKSNRGKRVNQISNKTGKVIGLWGSAADAARNTGVSRAQITSCCRNQKIKSRKYKFQYA